MIRAYDEIVEFIAAGTTPDLVATFVPSQQTNDVVADLIHKEKTVGLTPEESIELDHYTAPAKRYNRVRSVVMD